VLSSVIILLVAFLVIAQIRFLILCVMIRIVGDPEPSPLGRLTEVPRVAVQIATYREALALPSLLKAILALDWPTELLLVQIIDDSIGDDAKATREIVEHFAGQGVRIEYLNRNSRSGFKAGALNYGLTAARDVDLIAYFDADCRPRSDFLTRIVPRFADLRVSGVQARWEYPNGYSSSLTIAQQAAFEYLFRYEYGIRTYLESPVYYLGSAAVWRRQTIENLGGWRTSRFTAEDVDMGYRAGNSGWKVLYEPSVLADNDAVEEMLAFRAQQRRWAYAVSQAGLDARRGLMAAPWGWWARIVEFTALMPHATIPLTLITALLIALQTIFYNERGVLLDAMQWIFAMLVVLPPSFIALILATQYFHPRDRLLQLRRLIMAGPAAAATMTSFLFGLAELVMAKRIEFIATPKAGQVAVVGESSRRWLTKTYGPLIFDAISTILLLTGAGFAITRGALNTAIPTALLGAAFAGSLIQSIPAAWRHKARLNVAEAKYDS
jgi:cellulose synthase/poly-beta-1,6-N-acetylglucosamine synthase-like glycosyltransferase